MTSQEAYQALNANNRAMADQIIKALNFAQKDHSTTTQTNTTRAEERKKERREE